MKKSTIEKYIPADFNYIYRVFEKKKGNDLKLALFILKGKAGFINKNNEIKIEPPLFD